jgi:hypothetical protein
VPISWGISGGRRDHSFRPPTPPCLRFHARRFTKYMEACAGDRAMTQAPVQVLDEPGRANTKNSYVWVFRGGTPGKEVVLWRYSPTCSGDVPQEMLQGFRGYLQTDVFAAYNSVDGQVRILGCISPPTPGRENSTRLRRGRWSWRISTTTGPDMKSLSSSTTRLRRWRDPSPASLGQLVFDPGEKSPLRHSGINTERRKSKLPRNPHRGDHHGAVPWWHLPSCPVKSAQNRP